MEKSGQLRVPEALSPGKITGIGGLMGPRPVWTFEIEKILLALL